MTAEQRELRKLKKYLRELTRTTKRFLELLDQQMKEPSSHSRGVRIAKLCNILNMANDSARHFGLGEKL